MTLRYVVLFSLAFVFLFFVCIFFLFCFFFFFQAEDGIRDIGVTGVQTCALPISLLRSWTSLSMRRRMRVVFFSTDARSKTVVKPQRASISWSCEVSCSDERSEERRVGKECRSRWSPDH